ncbi:hypothetical protein GmHk_11G031990 [Glycine max]|nr:hypothetical protein GmHk_11G031990 [Glycine max]
MAKVAVQGLLKERKREDEMMDEDQWMYDNIVSKEADMNEQNEDEASVKSEHVNCSNVFNTSQVFTTRDDVLNWARVVAYEIGFVAVIMRLKNQDVIRDIFWCHPDAVKLCNAWMIFSASFAYLEGECVNNVVWDLERFQGLFLIPDALPRVIVTNRDLTFINIVKIVFLECTNLLYRFHIDKNVKTKCKSLVGQKNAWDYVMEAWGSLVDCPSKEDFNECFKKFEIACSPRPMFVDYVNQTWIIPHKERFVKAWTNKVMHLGNTTTNRYENWYALNQIVVEYERVSYAGIDGSRCGCVMRTGHGLPCAYELVRYVVGSIPLGVIHMFWQRLSFSNQGLSKPKVNITEKMETISKRFRTWCLWQSYSKE